MELNLWKIELLVRDNFSDDAKVTMTKEEIIEELEKKEISSGLEVISTKVTSAGTETKKK